MIDRDYILSEDFFNLLRKRIFRYSRVLGGKGGMLDSVIRSGINFENELNRLNIDFPIFNGDFWGYGINYIKLDDEEFINPEVEQIARVSELNKHHNPKYIVLNIIIFSVVGFEFQFHIFQLNVVQGNFISRNLEKLTIDEKLSIQFKTVNSNTIIILEGEKRLEFQLDRNLLTVFNRPHKFTKQIIDHINRKKEQKREIEKLPDNYTDDILEALNKNNVSEFINGLKSIISTIPYQIFGEHEKFYHAIMHIIVVMINRRTNSEISTSRGRSDTIIELKKYIYIIECKVTNAKEAIDQIYEKKYYEPYLRHKKVIHLIGISFDEEKKCISDWKSENLNMSKIS
ncbi:MAG: PD-(D/E)XK nuclease domain-containing protein [Bacteroidales bacterium]|nr:PD-(D/E)XK nuclease domain-containing protein [Bacteroidales bacterium]